MLTYIVYAASIFGVVISIYFIKSHWKKIKGSKVDVKASVLSNMIQVLILSTAVIVAIHTLDAVIFETERQQNISTEEMMDEIPFDELAALSDRYRVFARSVYAHKFYPAETENERRQFIKTLMEEGAENDYLKLSKRVNKLLICAETEVCNPDRIFPMVCHLMGDYVRNLVREPVIRDLDSGVTNFIYSSRERLAVLQRRSCGWVDYAIDYVDEKYF